MTNTERAGTNTQLTDLQLTTAHIVIAEDDADTRAALCELLTSKGYRVTQVCDGSQLLELLQASQYSPVDLIVTDIWMPFATGVESVKMMRRLGWRTPVILITGFGDDYTHALASSLDARVLEKPPNSEALCQAVSAELAPSDAALLV